MLANSHDLVSWSSQPTGTSLLVVSSAVSHSTPDLPPSSSSPPPLFLFFPSPLHLSDNHHQQLYNFSFLTP